jgi:RNA polymerase sigma-70 factor, ECF subfamily
MSRPIGYITSEMIPDPSPLSLDQQKELMRLMTQHQRRLYGYIYTMLPYREAAEDVLQETSLTICEKFSQFQTGTDFVAWAFQVAYWEVRRAKQKYARSKLVFGEDALAAVAATAAEMAPEMDARHEALQHCLKKLHPRDREFVLLRYECAQGVEAAAKRVGRSLFAAYKALNRIRKLLLDCVSQQLEVEGRS